jgi:hypothetical protein
MSKRLDHRPLTLADACAFVTKLHRHHRAPVGHKFSLGAFEGDRLCGVAIIGRPVARLIDHTTTLEITRLCTDGTKDAASFLLGRARAAVFALGYRKLITYTLPSEGGASLRGAGYQLVGQRGGGTWSCPSRPRTDKAPTEPKFLWETAA